MFNPQLFPAIAIFGLNWGKRVVVLGAAPADPCTSHRQLLPPFAYQGYVVDDLVCVELSALPVFTAQAYARAALGVVILSVRLSIRLSHAWIVTKLNDARQIFWYHMKGKSLCYSDTNSGYWATLPSLWNLHSKWPTRLRETPTSTDFRL